MKIFKKTNNNYTKYMEQNNNNFIEKKRKRTKTTMVFYPYKFKEENYKYIKEFYQRSTEYCNKYGIAPNKISQQERQTIHTDRNYK